MTHRRILMLVLIAATVCMMGVGMGAAEDVSATISTSEFSGTYNVGLVDPYGDYDDDTILNKYDPLPAIAEDTSISWDIGNKWYYDYHDNSDNTYHRGVAVSDVTVIDNQTVYLLNDIGENGQLSSFYKIYTPGLNLIGVGVGVDNYLDVIIDDYNFPLYAGKEWAYTDYYGGYYDLTVVGEELVTLANGQSFNAYRIEKWVHQGSFLHHETIWFSTDVKNYVKKVWYDALGNPYGFEELSTWLVDPYGDYDSDTILNKYDPLPAIAENTSISWTIGNKWYYDYHDNSGNTYHRGVAVSDVTVIDNQTVYLLNDIGENGQLSSFYEIYTPGLNLIGFGDGGDIHLDMIFDEYNFPLYAGKEWAYSDYYDTYTLTVAGEELVTLANGQSFNAYRIEKWRKWDDSYNSHSDHVETIWFSTDVKNYVKKVQYNAIGNPYSFEELSTWLVDPYGDYDGDTILNKYDPLPAIAEDTSISWTIGNKWYYDYHDNSGSIFHRGVAVSDVTVIDNQTVYLLNDIDENGQLSSFYEIYTPGLNLIGFGDGVDNYLDMIFDDYNFPLYAGKEWAYSDYYGIYTYTYTHTVAGEELVTLANGQSFNAYRIEKWRKWDNSYNSHSDHVETIWFSTDVKNYVKRVFYDALGNPSGFEELDSINYNAEKKLLQIEGQPEVYWLQNNKLYWVTDWDVINQMSGIPGWDSVNALPASEFDPAAYEQGARFIDTGAISDGLLIREQGQPEVYLISGGEKHHIISEEVFLSMGYSFDDVIDVSPQIIEIFPTGSDIGAGFTVGQGASTPEITEAFNVAYEKNGGVTVLGDPTSAVYNKWGYEVQEFPGTDTYPGGITIYNPDKSAAFYIHGDIWNRYNALGGPVATTDKEFQLGIPTSDVLPYAHLDKPKISKYDTPYRHQNFESDNEKAALVHNLNSGKVVEIHGEIYKKWLIHGNLADGVLGLVTEDEMKAGQSPRGKTGRYSKFENGTIHWNEQSGRAYITSGDLDKKYTSLDGTNHWLGFPVMDQVVMDGREYSKFDGGHIFWDESISNYREITKLIAIVPIEFKDKKHIDGTEAKDLSKNADDLSDYYNSQSYGKEHIGYKLFLNDGNEGWYRISENYADIEKKHKGDILFETPSDLECVNCFLPDNVIATRYIFFVAMNKIGQNVSKIQKNYYHPENYDLAILASPFKATKGDAIWPAMHGRPVMDERYASGFIYVDNRPQSVWYHEMGHVYFRLGHTAAGNWDIMSPHNENMNPPPPSILYNKERAGWIVPSEPKTDFGIYLVRNINDETIEQEGSLKYKNYIFEGRFPTDNVELMAGINENLILSEEEGIEIYQVEKSGINALEHEDGWIDNKNKVSMIPDDTIYVNYGNVKITAFKKSDGLKIKIEEIPLSDYHLWKITTSPIGTPITPPEVAIPENIYLDVDLHMKSKDGRKIGKDYSTGEYVNEIEGSRASGNYLGGGSEWISIPQNIDAEVFVELTSNLKELIRNDETANVEIISALVVYDKNGNKKESTPVSININSKNVDSPLTVSLPINITFLPPITTIDQFSLTDGSTLPIKFTARNSTTGEFIYDPTVNVTITNSTGHLVTYFTNGTGTDNVRINSEEEQYILNFHTRNYDLDVGETYAVTITFGESDSLTGYEMTYFNLMEGRKAKGKNK